MGKKGQVGPWLQSFKGRSDTTGGMECGVVLSRTPVAEAVNSLDMKPLGELFHRLNNELGIILSHAELLEAKCAEPTNRSRASQVVAAALEAMGTARMIRTHVSDLTPGK